MLLIINGGQLFNVPFSLLLWPRSERMKYRFYYTRGLSKGFRSYPLPFYPKLSALMLAAGMPASSSAACNNRKRTQRERRVGHSVSIVSSALSHHLGTSSGFSLDNELLSTKKGRKGRREIREKKCRNNSLSPATVQRRGAARRSRTWVLRSRGLSRP